MHLNVTILINPGIKQRINSRAQVFYISKEMRDKRAWKLLPCQRKFCESIVWCIWGVEEKGMFKYALFIYWYIVDGHEIHQAPTMTMVWKSEVSRRTNLYHKMRTGKTCVRVYTKKLSRISRIFIDMKNHCD